MTDGLAAFGGWIEFAAILAVLAWFVLRRSAKAGQDEQE